VREGSGSVGWRDSCARRPFSSPLSVAVLPFGQLLLGCAPLPVEQVVGDETLTSLGRRGEPLTEFGCEIRIVAEVVAWLWLWAAHGVLS
jgi:hypothetical protein